MTFRIKDKSLVPTKGWRALQPETGVILKAATLPALGAAVREYRTANNLEIEVNFTRQLGDQVCRALSPEEQEQRCRYLADDDAQNPKHLRVFNKTRQDLRDFAVAVEEVAAAALAGAPLHVSQDEAERRASICVKCPQNVPLAPCFGCGKLGALYRKVQGNLRTSRDPLLESCGVCGCGNQLQVHMDGGVLGTISERQGVGADDFPSHCWKKEILTK